MCKCTPGVRTPYCGKPGCKWPKEEHDAMRTGGVTVSDLKKHLDMLQVPDDAKVILHNQREPLRHVGIWREGNEVYLR
jgi:hypothetical protein